MELDFYSNIFGFSTTKDISSDRINISYKGLTNHLRKGDTHKLIFLQIKTRQLWHAPADIKRFETNIRRL